MKKELFAEAISDLLLLKHSSELAVTIDPEEQLVSSVVFLVLALVVEVSHELLRKGSCCYE